MTTDHEAEHSRPDDEDPAPGMHPKIGTPKADAVVVTVPVILALEIDVDLTDYDKNWHNDLIAHAIRKVVHKIVNDLPTNARHVRTYVASHSADKEA
jgi:hypothetical protein